MRFYHDRAEFQQHKKADAKFVPMFMSEWTKYYDTLIATPPSAKVRTDYTITHKVIRECV
jgi:hypothetical protein